MNGLNYLDTGRFDARAIREENATACAEANRRAANQLVRAERDYWEAFLARADSIDDSEYALEKLRELDRLEVSRHG